MFLLTAIFLGVSGKFDLFHLYFYSFVQGWHTYTVELQWLEHLWDHEN